MIATLEERPKRLDTVRVRPSIHILANRILHAPVRVRHAPASSRVVRIDRGLGGSQPQRPNRAVFPDQSQTQTGHLRDWWNHP